MSIDLTYSSQDSILSQGLADVLDSSVLKDVKLSCSEHDGSSLPPNKRQRVEESFFSSGKPSTLFRPWDSPVLPPRPEYHQPWIPFMYGISPWSNLMPFQMPHGNNLSKAVPITMSAGSNIFSEAFLSLPITMMPWSLPYGNPNLSVTSPSLPINVENPFTETAAIPILESNSIPGEQLPIVAKKQRGRPKKDTSKVEVKGPKARYLVPGKERCDICNCDYLNVKSHKKAAHGLLKKPIECCGVKFVTGKEFKLHRRTHKY